MKYSELVQLAEDVVAREGWGDHVEGGVLYSLLDHKVQVTPKLANFVRVMLKELERYQEHQKKVESL